MKLLAWLLGIVMVIAVAFFGLQIAASETGEVVLLHTAEDGKDHVTRLWVVEHEGDLWLRAGGGADSGWFERLQANPRVGLERDGVRREFTARPEPAQADVINALMSQKYGWRDRVVAALAGAREGAVPVRLVPAGTAPPR